MVLSLDYGTLSSFDELQILPFFKSFTTINSYHSNANLNSLDAIECDPRSYCVYLCG